MTNLLDMPQVSDCRATSCADNHDGCPTFAVNIDFRAACGISLSLNEKGERNVVAQVGAYQRKDCVHDEALDFRATSITVGSTSATADCLSYQAA